MFKKSFSLMLVIALVTSLFTTMMPFKAEASNYYYTWEKFTSKRVTEYRVGTRSISDGTGYRGFTGFTGYSLDPATGVLITTGQLVNINDAGQAIPHSTGSYSSKSVYNKKADGTITESTNSQSWCNLDCTAFTKSGEFYSEYTILSTPIEVDKPVDSLGKVKSASRSTYPSDKVHTDGYYYVYKGYVNNNPPMVTVTTSGNKIIYNDAPLKITGTVADVDNQNVTITINIGGSTKSTVISADQYYKNWELTWNAGEIPVGTYTNPVVTANDGLDTTTKNYSGVIEIKPQIYYYWTKYNVKADSSWSPYSTNGGTFYMKILRSAVNETNPSEYNQMFAMAVDNKVYSNISVSGSSLLLQDSISTPYTNYTWLVYFLKNGTYYALQNNYRPGDTSIALIEVTSNPTKVAGSVIQSNLKAAQGTYPDNGIHSDGYWYVKGSTLPNNVPSIRSTIIEQKTITLKPGSDTFQIKGVASDADGDALTVTSTIGGITKDVVITNTKTEQPWELTWKTQELPEGVFSGVTVTVDDGKGGTVSIPNSSKVTVIQTLLFYWDRYGLVDKEKYVAVGDSPTQDVGGSMWGNTSYTIDNQFGIFVLRGSYTSVDDAGVIYAMSSTFYDKITEYRREGGYVVKRTLSLNKISIKEKGSLVESNLIDLDKTYPDNGLHSDGFWYVKKSTTNMPPALSVNSSDLLIGEEGAVVLKGQVRKSDVPVNSTKPVKITATINGIEKITEVQTNTSSGEWTLSWSASDLPAFGEYTGIQVTADDNSGGKDQVTYTGVILIDRTNPTAPVITNDTNWSSTPVEVAIDPGVDEESGVVKTEYKIGDGEWTLYTGPFTVTQEGEQQIHARTTNRVGGYTDAEPSVTKVATTPPTSPKISLDRQGWSKEDVNVTVGESYGFSDISYFYKISDGDWVEGTTTTINTAGLTGITAKAVNVVGLESPEVTASVMIDKEAPVVQVTPNGSTWSMGPSSVAIDVQDALSGVLPLSSQYAITVDTAMPTEWHVLPLDNVVNVTKQGSWYLHIKSEDLAGNVVTFVSSPYQYQGEPVAPQLEVSGVESTSAVLDWGLPLSGYTGSYTYDIVDASSGVVSTQTYPTSSYTLNNLQEGTQHSYTLVAKNHVGTVSSNEVSFLTKPSVPTILSVDKVGFDASEVDIVIDTVQSANSYRYVVKESVSGAEVINDVYPNTNYRATGLTSGMRYTVTVSAINETGESGTSSVGFITLPTVPANFSVVKIYDDSINLFWEPVDSATDYNLSRFTDVVYRGQETSFKDVNLSSGSRYNYTLHAENEMGEGESAMLDNVVTLPTKVTGVTISGVTQTSAVVSWNAGNGVDKYELEVSNGDNQTLSGSELNANLNGLMPGEAYTVNVIANNESGSGKSSDTITFVTLPEQLDQVGMYVDDIEETSANVHFTEAKGATKYRITADGVVYETSATSYPLTDLKGGKEVTVTVEAGNASGYSGLPIQYTFLTKPSKITNIKLTDLTDSSFILHWDKGEHDNYKITVNGIEYEVLSDGSFKIENLPAGEVVDVVVIAYNTAGEGEPTELKVMTKQLPVTGVEMKVEENEVIISYDPVNGSSGDIVILDNNNVEIYRGKDNPIKLPITAGEDYHYKVVVENREGVASDYTDIIFKSLPQEPIGIKVGQIGINDVSLVLSGVVAKGIDSIVVYQDGKEVTRFLATVKERKITGLVENTEYVYIVKGENTSGESNKSIQLKFKTQKKIIPVDNNESYSGNNSEKSTSEIKSTKTEESKEPTKPVEEPTKADKPVVEKTESTKYYQDLGNSFAIKAINTLTDLQIVKGVQDGMFEPNREITRAELAALLVRATKSSRAGDLILTFKDVNRKDWYYEELSAAIQNEIASGFSKDMFKPLDDVNREQASKMIANVLYNFYGYSSPGKNSSIFTDASQIAVWAKDSIDMMTVHSIIKGYPDGSFKPKGNLTRAESAELIYRMLSLDPKAKI